MGIVQLTDHNRRTDFFQETVRLNLDYWQSRLAETEETAVAALDQARTAIVRAILFGLELGPPAWPDTHPLIDRFSPFMERRGHWDTWDTVLRRAVASAQAAGDEARLVHLTALLARLSQRQGHFKQMVSDYRRTSRLARRLGDCFNQARSYTNLGFFYIEQGCLLRAEVLCCRALQLFEQIDNNHGRAHTANHLGLLYTRRGSWHRAENYLKQANTIWQAMADYHGLMFAFTNLGVLYVEMGAVDKALSCSKKALHWAEFTGEELTKGTIYVNIGTAHRLKNELVDAEAYIHRAKAIFQQFSNTFGLALVFDNLGLIYLAQKQWNRAGSQLEKALETWRKLDNKYGEIRAMTYYIDYEVAQENICQAKRWLQETEFQLNQYDSTRMYEQLHIRLAEHRRSLSDLLDC